MKKEYLGFKTTDFKLKNSLGFMFFIVWACVVLYLTSIHVFWMDEVRALSFALQGNSFVEMWQGVHGEGHPILWYALLRFTHALWSKPEVLPIVAFVVAALSFWLLVFRSQFSLLLIALILSSNFALYEYSVMARNYGISMLILFMLAMYYKDYRYRGVMIGALLFLLANCNVHSVVLVCSFLMFWFFDSIFKKDINQKKFLKIFILNAAIAFLGIIVCFLTVYPTFNDAVRTGMPDVTFKSLLNAVLLPTESLNLLYEFSRISNTLANLAFWQQPYMMMIKAPLLSLALYGSALVLIRRPAALFATWAVLIIFSCFFSFIYLGGYRHQALWLAFLLSMYWICLRDEQQEVQKTSNKSNSLLKINAVKTTGYGLLILLMVMQCGILPAKWLIKSGIPESRSRDFGLLIDSKPELKDATLIADPDFLLEALPYYVQNRTYLMRQQKFGKINAFTKKARLNLTLDDILTTANSLKNNLGKPVVILMMHKLNSTAPQVIKEGFNWTLTTTPEQVQTFLKSTRLIASFEPVLATHESYDVYLLN